MTRHPTSPPPAGWPRIAASIFYEDAPAAIDWLCNAFGFEVRLTVEADGDIAHSELVYGDGLIMVGSVRARASRENTFPCASPKSIDGINTQVMCVCVDDVDAHHAEAVAAGAKIVDPPRTDDYGEDYWVDRSYRAEDPEGHQWWFLQRLRDPTGG